MYDNGGVGYPIQDNIFFLSSHSCLVQDVDENGNWNLTAVAAVSALALFLALFTNDVGAGPE